MSEPLTCQESVLLTGLANDLAAGRALGGTARRTLAELADRAAVQTQRFGGLGEDLEALLELVRERVVEVQARRDEMIAKTVELQMRTMSSTPSSRRGVGTRLTDRGRHYSVRRW